MEIEGIKFQTQRKDVEIAGYKIGVVNIPFAGSGVQFLLTSKINEIMSVGFGDFEGEITWKFGKPKEELLPQIEEELRKMFELGKYFKG